MEAFWTGVLAGYGIAIPVGAISVLIVEVAIRCGFWCGFSAGAGAATADFLYSSLAVIGGVGLASRVETIGAPLRVASALVLILVAVSGLRRIGREPRPATVVFPSRSELAITYGRFVGLTMVNPTTVIYFAAFVVGIGVANDMTALQGAVFALGALTASLSWQTLLAGVGATAGKRLTRKAQRVAVVFGNLIVLGFAVLILLQGSLT